MKSKGAVYIYFFMGELSWRYQHRSCLIKNSTHFSHPVVIKTTIKLQPYPCIFQILIVQNIDINISFTQITCFLKPICTEFYLPHGIRKPCECRFMKTKLRFGGEDAIRSSTGQDTFAAKSIHFVGVILNFAHENEIVWQTFLNSRLKARTCAT